MSIKKINEFLSIVEESFLKNMLIAYGKGREVNFPKIICIIGAGGTGSWFAPKLTKILNDARSKGLLASDKTTVVFIDGDDVEEKNLIRQNFIKADVGKNKAKVLSDRYNSQLDSPFFNSGYIDKYIYDSSLQEIKKEDEEYFIEIKEIPLLNGLTYKNVLFINLIDNAMARKTVHLLASTANKSIVIDVANNQYNGQLTTSLYGSSGALDGIDAIRSNFYNELESHLELNDEVSVHSCADADSESVDQLFNANDMAASILGNYVNDWIVKGKLFYGGIEFVTGSNLSINKINKFYGRRFINDLLLYEGGYEMLNEEDNFGDAVLMELKRANSSNRSITILKREVYQYLSVEKSDYIDKIKRSLRG